MPDLETGPGPGRDLTTPDPAGHDLRAPAEARTPLSSEPMVARSLQQSFDALYADAPGAQRNFQSLSEFAGSRTAADLLATGGAAGAERLGALNPALSPQQRRNVPVALGRALGEFAPQQDGIVKDIVPGGSVLRDAGGVPSIQALKPEPNAVKAGAPGATQNKGEPAWVIGIGLELRGQLFVISGSTVGGIVFDDDGSFGVFAGVGVGIGPGLGVVGGGTGFGVTGVGDIDDVAGGGIQLGGFGAAIAGADASFTIPMSADGDFTGIGVAVPVTPAWGGGAGAYLEGAHTKVTRLFEMRELVERGGAALEELTGTPEKIIRNMMSALDIDSYDAMAAHMITMHKRVAAQLG